MSCDETTRYDGFFFVQKVSSKETKATKYKLLQKIFSCIILSLPVVIVDTLGPLKTCTLFFDECKDSKLHANQSPHMFRPRDYMEPS